jgi:hypothetical protein
MFVILPVGFPVVLSFAIHQLAVAHVVVSVADLNTPLVF